MSLVLLTRARLNWDKGDLTTYRNILTSQLSAVSLPTDALVCNGLCDGTHCNALEEYYTCTSLISCMHSAAEFSIPVCKVGVTLFLVKTFVHIHILA